MAARRRSSGSGATGRRARSLEVIRMAAAARHFDPGSVRESELALVAAVAADE